MREKKRSNEKKIFEYGADKSEKEESKKNKESEGYEKEESKEE